MKDAWQSAFADIKNALSQSLVDLYNEQDFLVGITPVGSHAVSDKKMEMMNDLDIVFVFDVLTKEKWDSILRYLEQFAHERSTEEIGIVVETRFGPFKMSSGRAVTVQIHALFFDLESYRAYANMSHLVATDWHRFDPLVGESLASIAPIPFLTAEDIIQHRGGIDYCLEQLKDGVNIALTRHFDEDGVLQKAIEKIPQTDQQKAETCYKSVKNVLVSVYKLQQQKNELPDDSAIKSIGKDILGDSFLQEFSSLEALYVRARSGGVVSVEDIQRAQGITKEMLFSLKSFLVSYENI